MSRLAPIHWKILEKFFLAKGFRFARQSGSHRSYIKEGISRPVIIPTYTEVPISIIKNNLKTAGITREEYLKFLSTGEMS